MSAHHQDDTLPTLDLAELGQVIGGADAMSSMLPMMMMMMMRRSQAAPAQVAAPPPAPAWKPKILVDGVEQPLSSTGNGTFTSTTSG